MITFLIVTYNGDYWIQRCLQSIKIAAPRSEIILVDNCSTDDTIEIAQKFSGIKIIKLEENIGFGAANNIGLEQIDYTRTEFAFLLNQDAYLHEDAISNFLRDCDENFGIHALLQLSGDGTQFDPHFKRNYLQDDKCPGFYQDAFFGRVKSTYEIIESSAAAWILPKSTIFKIGGFNPSFFHYGEDTNYIHRLHFHGLKMGLYPNSVVFHDRIDSENRQFYRTQKIKELRYWLTHQSNPINTQSRRETIRMLISDMIKALVRLQKFQADLAIAKLAILRNHKIFANKETSRKSGPTFLSVIHD